MLRLIVLGAVFHTAKEHDAWFEETSRIQYVELRKAFQLGDEERGFRS